MNTFAAAWLEIQSTLGVDCRFTAKIMSKWFVEKVKTPECKLINVPGINRSPPYPQCLIEGKLAESKA